MNLQNEITGPIETEETYKLHSSHRESLTIMELNPTVTT